MVTQQMNLRRLTGDGERTPPGIDLGSGSEGDRRKNSYRQSALHERAWQLAICGDDGKPIASGTEARLDALTAEVQELRKGIAEIVQLLRAVT